MGISSIDISIVNQSMSCGHCSSSELRSLMSSCSCDFMLRILSRNLANLVSASLALLESRRGLGSVAPRVWPERRLPSAEGLCSEMMVFSFFDTIPHLADPYCCS